MAIPPGGTLVLAGLMERGFFSQVWRLTWSAAWAPVAVLIFHDLIASTSWRRPLDFTMHFLGGVSITFFLLSALEIFPNWTGPLKTPARLLFSFSLACTVGVFWEFAEFFRDTFYGTHIQQSVKETMSDLIADACGASVLLGLVVCWRFLRPPRSVLPAVEPPK